MKIQPLDALYGFLIALAASAALAPVTARLARRVGAVDEPRERGLSRRPTPLLGGLAILAGVLLAGLLLLPEDRETRGILIGAGLITLLGAIDDVLDLSAGWKLAGQFAAAVPAVTAGIKVDHFTLPWIGAVSLGHAGGPITLVGLVFLMNVVNFSDGVDGLAAGVGTISAIAFAVIAWDLGQHAAGLLAAIIAGAALGFLFHNFHPAAVFMGDSGSNLLGLLLGVVAVQGTIKTNAVVALVVPLVVLAVPFLDTSFVLAKRIKYGRPVYLADRWHFHHRFANIGFSQRRTVLYLYAWTAALSALAVAFRFVPYSDHHGHFHAGWLAVLACLCLLAFAASVYLVVVLEILKFRRLRSWQLRRVDPATTEEQVVATVARELETGELGPIDSPAARGPASAPDRNGTGEFQPLGGRER